VKTMIASARCACRDSKHGRERSSGGAGRASVRCRWTSADTVRGDAGVRAPVPHRTVRDYAARYAYEDDAEVIATGRTARERGYYTRDEFLAVCRWKTPRSAPLVALNRADSIEAATRVALGESSTERERMDALRSLRGVDWPTASVLLHLAYPERYPILDKRALQALGVRRPAVYSFRFWEAYTEACVGLAGQADVDGRTFDQGLWQWSKEQGVALY
jgi:hypothetical protein